MGDKISAAVAVTGQTEDGGTEPGKDNSSERLVQTTADDNPVTRLVQTAIDEAG